MCRESIRFACFLCTIRPTPRTLVVMQKEWNWDGAPHATPHCTHDAIMPLWLAPLYQYWALDGHPPAPKHSKVHPHSSCLSRGSRTAPRMPPTHGIHSPASNPPPPPPTHTHTGQRLHRVRALGSSDNTREAMRPGTTDRAGAAVTARPKKTRLPHSVACTTEDESVDQHRPLDDCLLPSVDGLPTVAIGVSPGHTSHIDGGSCRTAPGAEAGAHLPLRFRLRIQPHKIRPILDVSDEVPRGVHIAQLLPDSFEHAGLPTNGDADGPSDGRLDTGRSTARFNVLCTIAEASTGQQYI